MQDFLHIRTLIFVSGITSLVLFACMLYIWKHQKTYPGFLKWTFSSLANATGMLLIGFRSIVPDLVTVVVADTLLMAAMMLITSGFHLFVGNKPRNTFYSGVLLIFLLFMLFCTYAWPSFNLRVIVYSLIQATLCITAASIVYWQVPRVLPKRDIQYVWFFMLCAGIPVMRILATIFDTPNATELMTSGIFHQAAVLIGLNFYIIVDIGLIVLTSQRIDFELIKAKDEIKTLTGLIPICANCKKIRDDKGSWNQLEEYISEHADVMFSHGICPECLKELYPDIKI